MRGAPKLLARLSSDTYSASFGAHCDLIRHGKALALSDGNACHGQPRRPERLLIREALPDRCLTSSQDHDGPPGRRDKLVPHICHCRIAGATHVPLVTGRYPVLLSKSCHDLEPPYGIEP